VRVLFLMVFGFFVVTAPALAAVEVGDQLPTKLELSDKDGNAQSFDSVKGEKGAVLVFVRSADWCPYCQVQLLDLRGEDGARITDLGYSIVTVSYDAPELLNKFATRYKFEHTMLSDEGSGTIKAFGVLNEDFAPDHFAYGVPHPHVYIVNAQGVIQAVLAEESYKVRPKVDVIVEAIEQ